MANDPLVQNPNDRDQVKAAVKAEKVQKIKEENDLRWILSTPQGRRFIWRILSHCGIFKSIWRQNSEIHYLAGVRDVGLFVLAECTAAEPNSFIQMMTEHKEEKTP